MKIILLFCLLSLGLFSCRQTIEDNFPKTAQLVFKPKFEGLDAFLNYQDKIEQRKDLKVLPSLFFTHKSGATIESRAFLNADDEILKATIDRIDTNGKKLSLTFYFLKEVLSMVCMEEQNLRSSLSNAARTEYFVFYNANQSPIASYTRARKGQPDNTPFRSFKLLNERHQAIQANLLLLSDMQNQEGFFELYFQGFDEAFNKKFVQFGNDNYSTNLAYAPQEELIKALSKNSEAYKGQKFNIQHQPVQEASGLQYQVLVAIEKR
ncbi:MAG: hypothetical protein ACKO5N_00490 [Sphingomonadales bacterium]